MLKIEKKENFIVLLIILLSLLGMTYVLYQNTTGDMDKSPIEKVNDFECENNYCELPGQ